MAATKRSSSKLITATKQAALTQRRARLAALEKLIRRRIASIVDSFYDIGLALDEVQKKKLYAGGGFASLDAFLEAKKLMSPAQAAKLIAIVRNVPREQALSVGQEAAYAFVALARATPEPDSAAELIAHGTVDGGPAAKAPVRAIKAEAKALRDAAPKSPAQRARAKADAAIAKGVKALLKGAGVTPTGVSVVRDEVRVVLSRAAAAKALGVDEE